MKCSNTPKRTALRHAVALSLAGVLPGCGGGDEADPDPAARTPQVEFAEQPQASFLQIGAGVAINVSGANVTPASLAGLFVGGQPITLDMQALVASGRATVTAHEDGFVIESAQGVNRFVAEAAEGAEVATPIEALVNGVRVHVTTSESANNASAVSLERPLSALIQAIGAASTATCPTIKWYYPVANWGNKTCKYGGTTCGKTGWAHTGVDFGDTGTVVSVADGTIVRVEKMSLSDHGMGNNIVVKHTTGCRSIFVTYSHLATIDSRVAAGKAIPAGFVLGKAGGSGYGRANYWPVHLHLEFKTASVTGNPLGVGIRNSTCQSDALKAAANTCWGYVSAKLGANAYGYLDPMIYLSTANSTPIPR